MDRSAVQAIVARELEGLRNRMGLADWNLRVQFGPCSRPGWVASCENQPDYNRSTITIDPAVHDDEAEVLDSLVHELCHAVLAPFDVYREAMLQLVPDFNSSPEGKQEDRYWTYFVEQAVANLERMYRGLSSAAPPQPQPPTPEEPDMAKPKGPKPKGPKGPKC